QVRVFHSTHTRHPSGWRVSFFTVPHVTITEALPERTEACDRLHLDNPRTVIAPRYNVDAFLEQRIPHLPELVIRVDLHSIEPSKPDVIRVSLRRHQTKRQRSLPDARVDWPHVSERHAPGSRGTTLVPGRDDILRAHELLFSLVALPAAHNDEVTPNHSRGT